MQNLPIWSNIGYSNSPTFAPRISKPSFFLLANHFFQIPMKKSIFIALFAALVWSSCQTGPADLKSKINLLEQQNKELEEDKSVITKEYNEVVNTLNEIETVLAEINTRERQMNSMVGELSNSSQKEVVLNKLKALEQQNIEAQAKAKKLQEQLGKGKVENASLQQMIQQYDTRIAEKDKQIEEYSIMLNQAEAKIKFTQDELTKQFAIVEQQRDELTRKNQDLEARNKELLSTQNVVKEKEAVISDCSRAYYVAGTRKDLRKADIIKGVGTQLQSDWQVKVPKERPINFYKQTEIKTNSVIDAILPKRDEAFYEIDGNTLRIKDIEGFWQTKMVVLVLDRE